MWHGLGAFGLLAWASLAVSAPVQEVVVVFKTHFDIGYTDMASNIVNRYRTTMIDQALEVCDRNRDLPPEQRFVWTLSGWPASKIYDDWPGQTRERQQRLGQAIKEGRFAVHALPFTTHTELLELEDLAHGLGFASRLSRQAGLPLPRDAKMTDVPCHTWALASLLRHAGVDFLHLGCNAASRSPDLPALFWWEGPDGSRLLTMYTGEGYGTGLVPPRDWPYPVWLALIHTGDNHGPPNPDEIQKLLADAKRLLPGVRVRIGRLSDFSDALQESKTQIPVVRGDMPDTWIHGPMCDPQGAKLARNTRPWIGATETLRTLLEGWGTAAGAALTLSPAASAVATAYENSLLYGEHTWGGALYWVTGYGKDLNWHYGETWKKERAQGRFTRLESSWAEHTSYIETAAKQIQPLLEAELQTLAKSVNVEGPRLVVFNPLPWKRSGLVRVSGPVQGVHTLAPCPRDQMVGGGVVLAEPVEGSIQFMAKDIPALGYRTYEVNKDLGLAGRDRFRLRAENGTLESPFFKLTLDSTRGCIQSLVDKMSKREWVDPGAPHGLGQYLYERFDADQVQAFVRDYVKIKADWGDAELGKPAMPPATNTPYAAVSPTNWAISYQQSPSSASAILKAPAGRGMPQPVTLTITVYAALPCVDLEVVLQDKPADPWPEAGWICLPFKIDQPQFRLGRLGSIVDPLRDLVPGAGHHLFAVNSGVTITDGSGFGVGFCPLDSPLVSLDSPGQWKYSRDFKPQRPAAYVNLFNNQWTTNFRLWNEGLISSRVRLWGVHGTNANSGLITPAWEARLPLQAAFADAAAGKLPATQSGIEISRLSVLVTSYGPNPDGEGTLLRLWEQAGQSGQCQVWLPAGCEATLAQPVNLRGQPEGDPVPVRYHGLTIVVKPQSPSSFVLTTGNR